MTWRDRLVRAQFKGVPFWVDGTGYAKGRRINVRRLAGRDGSQQQDLGREPDTIDVQAFVWGPDYDQLRDDLEAAVVDEGPGVLTLPTRGDLYVRVTSGPVTTERRTDGGYCEVRFAVVVEERIAGQARARTDTAAELALASLMVRSLASEDYAERADTRGMGDRYLARTRGLVDLVVTTAGRVQVQSSTMLSPLAEASRSLDAVKHGLLAVMGQPRAFATAVVDVIYTAFAVYDVATSDPLSGVPSTLLTPFQRGRGARLVDRTASAFRAMGEPFVSLGESALAKRADENDRALSVLVRSGALSAAADGFGRAQFDSSTFALSVLGRQLSELDAVQALAGDALYHALDRLRAALVRHLVETAGRLPDVVRYRPAEPVPALLVAYQLYGDVAMEPDLIARNALRDPLRADGALEVLKP